MKLNAEIIHQKLREVLPVSLIGEPGQALTLSRPEFYLDEASTFTDDHVYICSADHLPRDPGIGKNVLLICLGDAPELDAFRGNCSIISVPAGENIFEVFNLVQDVFNKFDSWEESVNDILRRGASLTQMLERSMDIFGNPLLLIGADFNYLAYTEADHLRGRLGLKLDGPSFDENAMAAFLSMHDLATDIKEPLLLRLAGRTTLSVNIFDGDEFLGCLTVFGEYREIRKSDAELCLYFSRMLKQAIQLNPALAGERAALRRAVRDVVMGRPVEPEQMKAISAGNNRHEYVCVLFRPLEDTRPLPGGYVASLAESRFTDSMAFEIGGHVAALIPGDEEAGLAGFAEDLKMKCGVSQSFRNLYSARYAFAQAASAIKNGLQTQAADTVLYFENYILDQLLANAVGDTPVSFFCPEGLKRLQKHDLSSQVSYIETLKSYLDNNMSLSATASELMLHRSSLIDRLARIDQLLDCDLKDPDVRLTLQIVLRAEELKPAD